MAAAGIVLVIAGVAFKIGAFPFQIWIPDVYQGAPTPVTAFLAVASKAAGFIVLLVLVTEVFVPYEWLVTPRPHLHGRRDAPLREPCGAQAAQREAPDRALGGLPRGLHPPRRDLGGPLAFGGLGAVYFYLFAYLIASFAVFGVMTVLAGPDDSNQELGDYAGLAKESPFLAGVLACGLGSLAGFRPSSGFLGKLFVFVAAFHAGHLGLLAVAIAGVVISIYYYFGWIRAAYFSDEAPLSPETRARIDAGAGIQADVPDAGRPGSRLGRLGVLPGSAGPDSIGPMKRTGLSPGPVGKMCG
jgi:NADH-quinone oxidoreductase subunit N